MLCPYSFLLLPSPISLSSLLPSPLFVFHILLHLHLVFHLRITEPIFPAIFGPCLFLIQSNPTEPNPMPRNCDIPTPSSLISTKQGISLPNPPLLYRTNIATNQQTCPPPLLFSAPRSHVIYSPISRRRRAMPF